MVLARRAGVALVASALLAATGCSRDNTLASSSHPTPSYTSYVAMGDSYVAGPGIEPMDPASDGCLRSKVNWPALLAKDLDIPNFRDVSCSGARSDDLITARPAGSADQADAQIDAVATGTDLVTVGIGGNDEGVFGRLIYSCAASPAITDRACRPFLEDELAAILDRTTNRIATALERIRAKAPNATIILVGYLRVLPVRKGCVVTGLAATQSGLAVAGQTAIDTALASAAKRAKVGYISMGTVSAGHESCNGDRAWVNGLRNIQSNGAYLHPTAAGMRAVANIVSKRLAATDRD